MAEPAPPPLCWYEDGQRGGWSGLRPGAEPGPEGVIDPGDIEARITLVPGRRPYLARCRSGWEIDYADLGEAQAVMDRVWAEPAPPPYDPDAGAKRRRGSRKVANEPLPAGPLYGERSAPNRPD